MKLLIKRHDPTMGGLEPPKKKGDVGWDLVVSVDMILDSMQVFPTDIPCEVSVKIPAGHWGLITGRSGATRKSGLIILPGVIDEGYVGPLYACCINKSSLPIEVKAGDRISQLIIIRSAVPEYEMVDNLPSTDRGSSGFGSTDER